MTAPPKQPDPTPEAVTSPPAAQTDEDSQPIPPDTVQGMVVDEQSGERLADAVVRWQTTEVFTHTGEDGTFALSGLPPGEAVRLTAYVPGYFMSEADTQGGEGGVEIALHRHHDTDNPDYEWLPSGLLAGKGEDAGCAECHAATPEQLEAGLVLPYDEWLRDAHSQAAVNPRFLSMFSGTDLDGNQSPPTRYEFNRDYGQVPLPPDDSQPYYGPGYKLDFTKSDGNCATCHSPSAAIHAPHDTDPTQVEGVELEGVSCDFCHKIWDVKLDPDTGLPSPSRPGVMSLEFRRPPEGHQFFAGPLDDVAPGEDTYLPLQKESVFCAACHFGVFWDEVVYNSYGEWLDSPYSDPETGQTCQDCHMPVSWQTQFAQTDAGGLQRQAGSIRSHTMPGGADTDLLTEAVTLDLHAERDGEEIVVTITLTNDLTGHHVPTDSPLRHLILLVGASGEDGQPLTLLDGPTVPEWGGVGDPEEGYYAGLPGTAYAKVLEELWTEVSPTGAYWNPTRVVSDNRLAAFESDTTVYRFAVPEGGGVLVSGHLWYRRAYITLSDQKGWDDPDILMEWADLIVE